MTFTFFLVFFFNSVIGQEYVTSVSSLTATLPANRHMMDGGYDETSGLIWLFGGRLTNVDLTTVWTFNPVSEEFDTKPSLGFGISAEPSHIIIIDQIAYMLDGDRWDLQSYKNKSISLSHI